jgi:hypothetical protein
VADNLLRAILIVAGTLASVRAFVSRTVEANMPFSLGSYLLGVGTVVGALAFGFGGGVLLTHTAMKESPAGQTRIERLVRAEPETRAAPQASAAQVTPTPNPAAVGPNQVTTPDQDHPASVGAIKQDAGPVGWPAPVSRDPVPAAPKPDAARKPVPEAPRQIQAAREPQPPKQVEQTERTEVKAVDSKIDRSSRSAGRSRRYAERRQPDNDAPRVRQRMFMVQEEPAQEAVISRPPEQHFDLFGGFFGRPADAND